MKYVLECNCGSREFEWYGQDGRFVCEECGEKFLENEAGKHLLEEEV